VLTTTIAGVGGSIEVMSVIDWPCTIAMLSVIDVYSFEFRYSELYFTTIQMPMRCTSTLTLGSRASVVAARSTD
jgi:hypothetical protein